MIKWDLDTQYESDLSAIDKMINTTQFVKHVNFSFIDFNPNVLLISKGLPKQIENFDQ